jgi:gamma-glutamyltranspeptidase/glutathione hydrolase
MRLLLRSKIVFTFVLIFNFFCKPAVGFAERVTSGIVVSDNPLATQAGMEILKRGGNAVDAAVATAFALSVVDPASSGLGGGGFMVIYSSKDHRAHALDFRETAPAGIHADLYMRNGKAEPFLSLTGALAVAVPGQVAGLLQAHKRLGSMALPLLMIPAIRYASDGFPLDAPLRYAIERQHSRMKQFPELARVFLVKNEVPAQGEIVRQPELAESLKAIAQRGADIFYQGWIAEAIVDAVKKRGGVLSLDDLKNYKTVWREPLLGSYRKRTLIAMPPPSSGGVALIEMLNVLEGHQLSQIRHNSATYLHLLAEVMKHAFADRAHYLGDPDFVKAPLAMLMSKNYARWIRGRISPAKTYPPQYYGLTHFKAEQGGTTHFSVLDSFGNAVACTLSINTRFGSKILVPQTGIILNNEIDDFYIRPGGNIYGLVGNEANSLQPKKRPLSSMAPTIILAGDRPEMIVGGAGGPRIISATLQTILNVIDYRMPVDKAVAAPRIHHQWLPDTLYVETSITPETIKSLERRGHIIKERSGLGIVQAIVAKGSKVAGAADPRKQVTARSE